MERILVIEDHPTFRAYIAEMIGNMYPHARVFQARHGREGVTVALAEKPDVILLDMHMPVMDGYETARTLRATPDTHHIPLIAMTLQVNEQSQTLINFKKYCNAILFKPFHAAQLAAAMQLTRVQQ